MSIVRIQPEFTENFSIEVTPKRSYSAGDFDAVSGTYGDVTGSIFLYARRSEVEKEPRPLSPFVDRTLIEGGVSELDGYYDAAKHAAKVSGSNINELRGLLDKTSTLPLSARRQQTRDIIRFEPPVNLNKNYLIKRQVREILFPYYRDVYPTTMWSYHNYTCLNFFTGSATSDGSAGVVPTDTVLMYPNTNAGAGSTGNVYLPQGAFSFDFRINPRYTTPASDDVWQNGTIFHMSGVYAVSLLTGSSRDVNGLPDRFRLALQVLSGTFTPPSQIVDDASGIFLSRDNVLKRNHWHRVVIRWGTNARNFGTGTFVVDGVDAGTFVIPSSSLATDIGSSPDILYVGNFYEGPNTGSNLQSRFFSTTAATREGVVQLQSDPSTGDLDKPTGARFDHPLNAELHELRIWDEYIADETFQETATTSPTDLSRLLFYVPPFFTAESPKRTEVGSIGGVLQTPFFAIDSTTNDPFNAALSFGVGALYLNLENFTRDFAQANWPRAYNLTASQINATNDVKSAVEFLYSTGSVRKRNLTVLPCDDGQFKPDYSLLATGTITPVPKSGNINFSYANDLGAYDASMVRQTDLIPSNSFYPTITQESGTLFGSVVGATPDNPGVDPGEVLAIFQRTRDNSSNEVSIFDVSNLYYDRRILPESVEIVDSNVTGSGGRISIKLKDNGYGSLYRADAETEHAKWASVGNVLYDEGIIVVKTPHTPYFGKESFQLEFKGSHNIHTMKVRVPAGAGMHTSSSNPSFKPLSASFDANEYDPRFVYITGINLHDENMNVVMKTTLAQPIIKRTGDRIMFKVAMDW